MADYDVAAAIERIENELIVSMIRNMKRHKVEEVKERMQWSQWQAEQLLSLEMYKRRNAELYKKAFADINDKISGVILVARQEGGLGQEIRILNAIKNGYKPSKVSGRIQGAFLRTNDRKMNALIDETTKSMERAETAILRLASDQYRKTIFGSQMYAASGAGTYEQAVDMATKDFLRAGLNCVEYKNGRRVELSTYADMAVQTASKRAYLTGEGEKRHEWGISTVILNRRTNACPKCMPHVGKVYIDDVWSGGSDKPGKYPLLSTAIAAGLYHPNCKDTHTTYFEGVSAPPQPPTEEDIRNGIEKYNKNQKEKQIARNNKRKKRRKDNTLANK